MTLYNTRQLVVILVCGICFFCMFSFKILNKGRSEKAVLNQSPGFVYELNGKIRDPGFYFFENQQSLQELTKAGGGAACELQIPAAPGFCANGSRIVFDNPLCIERIDSRARLNFFMPVNMNYASSSDLVLIPGIGKKTAEAIISYRKENRGIKDIRELRAVKGLGAKRLEILKNYLTAEE